ncbi:META domain-containing protein [Thermoleophilia bacterium SCSIO 60948]|nr:META domain-containing protein [Thermoleophilia bacterium SCSIO 60948]
MGAIFATEEVTVGGETTALPEDGLRVKFFRFEGKDRIRWTYCNDNLGRFEVDGGTLRVDGGVTSTLMGCGDIPAADQNEMTRFFLSDPEWSYDGTQLTIESGSTSYVLEETGRD